jgi:hypothetical protein
VIVWATSSGQFIHPLSSSVSSSCTILSWYSLPCSCVMHFFRQLHGHCAITDSYGLMGSFLPRNDGFAMLAPPSVALTASLRSVDVKLVRRFHHPRIIAIYGLLAANAEGCPGPCH